MEPSGIMPFHPDDHLREQSTGTAQELEKIESKNRSVWAYSVR
jgi:hypothetical protein